LIVTTPEGASVERRKMPHLLGAEVRLTPARQGMAGPVRARRCARLWFCSSRVRAAGDRRK